MSDILKCEYGVKFILDENGLHFSKSALEIEILCDCLGISYFSTDSSYFVQHKDAYTLIQKLSKHHDILIV